MKVTQQIIEDIGIFTISGILNAHQEERLKLLLMNAVHGVERSVINLKNVKSIDYNCLKLLNKAYRTSQRLKRPIIITEVPDTYIKEIYGCTAGNDVASSGKRKTRNGKKEIAFSRGN